MSAPVAPTDAQVASIVADLEERMPMADCCLGVGVNPAAFRRGLVEGKKAKSGRWRDIFQRVTKAQIAGRRKGLLLLRDAVKSGNPAATNALIEEMRQPDEVLEEAPSDPIEFAKYRLADVRRRMGRANGIAYNQLFRQETELIKDLADLEEKRSTKVRGGASRTPAEVLADETSHARELAELHLQLYVVEYIRRHPGVFLATTSGRIEIMAG